MKTINFVTNANVNENEHMELQSIRIWSNLSKLHTQTNPHRDSIGYLPTQLGIYQPIYRLAGENDLKTMTFGD